MSSWLFPTYTLDMTSPSPLLYNTYYHIYNRGTNRENIFIEERNYDLFLRLYEKYLSPVTDLCVYCLLRNHFHLLVRVKSQEEILETKKTQGFPLQRLVMSSGETRRMQKPVNLINP